MAKRTKRRPKPAIPKAGATPVHRDYGKGGKLK